MQQEGSHTRQGHGAGHCIVSWIGRNSARAVEAQQGRIVYTDAHQGRQSGTFQNGVPRVGVGALKSNQTTVTRDCDVRTFASGVHKAAIGGGTVISNRTCEADHTAQTGLQRDMRTLHHEQVTTSR